VYTDSHLHLADIASREPGLLLNFPLAEWRGAVVAHSIEEFETSETLRRNLPPTVSGFGIHPQGIRWDTADFLCDLVKNGKISFIGEAGFDFFGDRPERIRNVENLKAQKDIFEFQLALADRFSLPLLIHARKAMDIILGYGPRLKRLPAVIFHGWPGRIQDAQALAEKGIPAFFSFGTTLMRSAKHAVETCRSVPVDRVLSETDAPWQPPSGETWTSPAQIVAVSASMARIRNLSEEAMLEQLAANFRAAFRMKV
jgi:TatD DNase family protein